MILTRERQRRDLVRRVALWEPLIGKEAATTAVHARRISQAGFLILLLWVAMGIVLQLIHLTGIAIVALTACCWPAILFCFVRGFRMNLKASRQAAKVAGTSDKARPPVNTVTAFRRWANRSEYARHSPH